MPRDIFKEMGIDPYAEGIAKRPPRDIFKELGIDPYEGMSPLEKMQKQIENGIRNSKLGKQLSKEVKDARKNPLGFAEDVLNSNIKFTQGASDAALNLGPQIVNAFLPKEKRLPLFQSGEGTAYDVGKIGGDIAAFLGGGAGLEAARGALESAPLVGKIAQSLGGDGIKGVARRALGSGAYGAIENPDNKLAGALTAAALSGGLDIPFRGIPKLFSTSKHQYSLSPEQILENFESANGTKTNLGNIIGDPGKQRLYENILTKVPFSGVNDKMAQTAHQVKLKGNEILQDILGNQNPEGLKKAIQEGLKKSYKGTLAEKENLWKEVNDISDQSGVIVGRENLGREAQNILSEIKESSELEGEIPRDIVKKLKQYSDDSTINNLRLSNIFKGTLGSEASRLYKESGKSYQYGIYKRLQDALKRDIEGAIEGSENPVLREKYNTAMKFHREEVAPFEEKEIAKFTRLGGDPDLILSSFLKTGQNDRSELLNKLLNKIPDQKGLVGYGYLSKAIEHGELNPLKLKNLYKSLGEQQKNTLFGKDLKKRLDRYTNLVTMNTKPLTLMANPETGQKVLDTIWPFLLVHGIGGAVGLAAGGLGTGLIGSAAAPAIGKILSSRLTSEKIREKVVKSLAEKGTKSTKDRTDQENLWRAIAQTLANEMRR